MKLTICCILFAALCLRAETPVRWVDATIQLDRDTVVPLGSFIKRAKIYTNGHVLTIETARNVRPSQVTCMGDTDFHLNGPADLQASGSMSTQELKEFMLGPPTPGWQRICHDPLVTPFLAFALRLFRAPQLPECASALRKWSL